MHLSVYLVVLSVSLGGCRDSAPRPNERAAPSSTRSSHAAGLPADSTANEASQSSVDSPKPFSERVVVFIEASSAEIGAAAAGYSEEDFGVVADDLMFYRSSAHEYLETRRLPVQTFTGRRSLDFVVRGAVRHYDLANVPTLDVIVLYDRDREPRIIAPNDLEAIDAYFGEL